MSEHPAAKLLKSRFEALFPECFESVKYEKPSKIFGFDGTIDADLGNGYKIRVIGSGNSWPRYKSVFYNSDNGVVLEALMTNTDYVLEDSLLAIDRRILDLNQLKITLSSMNEKIEALLDLFVEEWYKQFGSCAVTFNYLANELKLSSFPLLENEEGKLSSSRIEHFLSIHIESKKNKLRINRSLDADNNRVMFLSKS